MLKTIKKVAVLALLVVPVTVAAYNVTVNGVTLVLPSDSSTYSLESGSFDSFSIESTYFSLVIPAGVSARLSYAGSKQFTVSGLSKYTTSCSTSETVLVLDNEGGSTSATVTVTPSGTTCAGSSNTGGIISSSGGGGGGGSSTSVTATTPATTAVSAPSTQVTTQKPVATTPAVILKKTLQSGSKGADVRILQQFLAQDPKIYPQKTVNGVFGASTKKAVQLFQEKYGIAKKGDSGYGIVGPATRAKLQKLTSKPVSSAVTTTTKPTSTVTTKKATSSQIKALQDQLKALQKLLVKPVKK